MDFQVIAQSTVRPNRRLLIGREGRGYIQLDDSASPIAVPDDVFARLRSMEHYQSVLNIWSLATSEMVAQVAD